MAIGNKGSNLTEIKCGGIVSEVMKIKSPAVTKVLG